MKLKEFNTENCVVVRNTLPSVTISKIGLLNLNNAACELIKLKEGDQVVFHQDEENTDNFYIEKVTDKGFALRRKESISAGLIFNNSSLANTLIKAMNYHDDKKSYRIILAGQPTKFNKRTFYGLLLSNNI